MEILTKICTSCKTEKILDEFHKHKQGKHGRSPTCKICRKNYKESTKEMRAKWSHEYHLANKEKINSKHRQNYIKNKDKINKKHKNWQINNRDKMNKIAKKYRDKNHEKIKTRNRELYHENRNENLKYSKEWNIKNKERLKEKRKKDYEKNKDRLIKNSKKWRSKPENKIKIAEQAKKYYSIEENRQKRRERTRLRRKAKIQSDPCFAIIERLRGRIKSAFRNQNIIKSQRTIQLIGCTGEFLIEHLSTKFYPRSLEDNNKIPMTIDDLFGNQIEIDHIIPVWAFNMINESEQLKCFHYSNLQPLWKEDHRIKTDKDLQEFYNWKRSGLPLEIYLDPIKREQALNPYNTWL